MGKRRPAAIGPVEVQGKNGVVDIVAEDEADATELAKRRVSYFQARRRKGDRPQEPLRDVIPVDRRVGYKVRRIMETMPIRVRFWSSANLRARDHCRIYPYGGQAAGADCQRLHETRRGGGCERRGKRRPLPEICNAHGLPVLSFCDTPGFMVGRQRSTGRRATHVVPVPGGLETARAHRGDIFARGYGLGAMAMTGGSFRARVRRLCGPPGKLAAWGRKARSTWFQKGAGRQQDPVHARK